MFFKIIFDSGCLKYNFAPHIYFHCSADRHNIANRQEEVLLKASWQMKRKGIVGRRCGLWRAAGLAFIGLVLVEEALVRQVRGSLSIPLFKSLNGA